MKFNFLTLIFTIFHIFHVSGDNINSYTSSDEEEIEQKIDILNSAFSRIVGGHKGKIGQFPFSVSLRFSDSLSHFCGGFLITEKWIGTAAHCTKGKKPSNVVAVVGEVSRLKTKKTIKLEKFVIHPKYNPKSMINDISLIKTSVRVKFSSAVHAAKLCPTFVGGNVEGFISGFGFTSYPGIVSDVMKYAKVKTITNKECKDKMLPPNNANIFPTTICAVSNEKTTSGSCRGDSGTGLVRSDGVLIGIVSWGIPCGKGFPDAFTRIDVYKEWINSIVEGKKFN